jgi:hypothetical protein
MRKPKVAFTWKYVQVPKVWVQQLAACKCGSTYAVALLLLRRGWREREKQKAGWAPYTKEIVVEVGNIALAELNISRSCAL